MAFKHPQDARATLLELALGRAGTDRRLVRSSILGVFLCGGALVLLAGPELAEDLFSFCDRDHVLAFALPSADPIAATVNQREALNAAVQWS